MAIMVFEAKPPFEFSHEKSVHRKHSGDFEKSLRGDGTTHFIERKSTGAIVQQGPNVIEKARLFTNAYVRYAQRFCMFTG